MTDLIHRLTAWASVLLKAVGATPCLRPPAPALPDGQAQRLTPPLPPHRSPYAQDDALLDGMASRIVRPYLLAHEQRQRRHELAVAERADAGAMATPGRTVAGPYWLHELEAA